MQWILTLMTNLPISVWSTTNLQSTTESRSSNSNKFLEFFAPKNGKIKMKRLSTSKTTEKEQDLEELSHGF
jgi:hypothetical protein